MRFLVLQIFFYNKFLIQSLSCVLHRTLTRTCLGRGGFEQWLRASGRAKAGEQGFDEALEGVSRIIPQFDDFFSYDNRLNPIKAQTLANIYRPELRNLDPFLLLDEFEGSQKEGAGFPDHPHR